MTEPRTTPAPMVPLTVYLETVSELEMMRRACAAFILRGLDSTLGSAHLAARQLCTALTQANIPLPAEIEEALNAPDHVTAMMAVDADD